MMNIATLRMVFLSSALAMGGLIATTACAEEQPEPATETAGEQKPANRLFELRTYTTHPDRLEALHKRFRDHTNRLFKKHGMQLVAYWVPTDGDEASNTLIYVLAYPDRDAREASWRGFLNDPEWKRAFAASRQDGKIVEKVESKFMKATDYSPIK